MASLKVSSSQEYKNIYCRYRKNGNRTETEIQIERKIMRAGKLTEEQILEVMLIVWPVVNAQQFQIRYRLSDI